MQMSDGTQAGLAGGPVESRDLVGEDKGVSARGRANDGFDWAASVTGPGQGGEQGSTWDPMES